MTGIPATRVSARVSGRVQGVGFRWYVVRRARGLSLAGSASNHPDGTVSVVAEGTREACEALVDDLRAGVSTPGRVDAVTAEWSEATGLSGFVVE